MATKSLIFCSACVFVACALLLPLIGSSNISLSRAMAHVEPDQQILFDVRLPRVLLSLVAGGALAIAGVLSQALLRDALATPYTLGISSGASLGAVTAICLGWGQAGQLNGVWLASFAGAALAMLLVVAIASEGRRLSSFTLLLAGVTLNSICLALILFIQNLTTFGKALVVMRWLMGGIDSIEYPALIGLSAAVIPISVVMYFYSRSWNLLAVGEEWAAARGVSTNRMTWIGYFAISLLTGLATALTGPIGFVGLIVPHALRLKWGADHRMLLPCSFLLGASFLAVCDTAARMVLSPAEVPVGVITALLGGPFFIWLLRVRRKTAWL